LVTAATKRNRPSPKSQKLPWTDITTPVINTAAIANQRKSAKKKLIAASIVAWAASTGKPKTAAASGPARAEILRQQRGEEKQRENKEEDSCHHCRRARSAPKTQRSSDDRNQIEYKRTFKHGTTLPAASNSHNQGFP